MDDARKLIHPQNTIALIKEHAFLFKKRFGQNFLIDPRVLTRIIEGAGIGKTDTVLEIGPGIGTMTQALCEAAGEVIAVEIDRDLIPILQEETLKDYQNVRIIHGDILKTDVASLSEKPLKVVANLPYYITTPIIMGLFESGVPLESITVMVQKEVADRMQAAPGGKDYGALSLAVQFYAKAEILANVPANCFMPRPNVGSAVIHLTCHKTCPVAVRDSKYLFAVIRAAFAQRRKTLLNALKNDASLHLSREQVEAALSHLALPLDIRGERLSLAQFAALSDALQSSNSAKG